jgi:ATP-binding cassette subfamily B protein
MKSRKNMNKFARVIPLLKKTWPKILLGIVTLIIVDTIQLVIPKFTQRAIDGIQMGTIDKSALGHIAFYIFLLTLGIVVMRFLWRYLIIGNSFFIEKALRQDFYNHLLTLSQNFYNYNKIGDLMAHATNDLNAVRMLFGFGVIAASDIILMFLASLGFMVNINGRLTLLAIIPMPILTFIILFFGKRVHKYFGQVQGSFSDLSGMIQESISGVRVVKAFAQEESELKKMDTFSLDFVRKNIRMAKLQGVFNPLMTVIVSLSMIITLVFGGRAAISGDITIGEFIAFYSYLGMLVWPMIATGFIINMYQRGTASLLRLNKIFETNPEINDDKADMNIKGLSGSIEVKNLSFSYKPDELPKVLEDISFEIKPGETLAIVGPTGCGKTTIIDLLARIYNPVENAIFFDNQEIYKIPVEVLHRDLLMVPQEIFLFSDTIANNIALAHPGASKEEIIHAATLAQVHDDIEGFELGYETIVGERGVTLSGGQKQRVAIARALLGKPNILVLDDALSAVDTKTERSIIDHLVRIRKNKTTIIIAHRISSIQHAEKIIVINDKKIAEVGTHNELLAKKGLYWELKEKQKLEEKLSGGDDAR